MSDFWTKGVADGDLGGIRRVCDGWTEVLYGPSGKPAARCAHFKSLPKGSAPQIPPSHVGYGGQLFHGEWRNTGSVPATRQKRQPYGAARVGHVTVAKALTAAARTKFKTFVESAQAKRKAKRTKTKKVSKTAKRTAGKRFVTKTDKNGKKYCWDEKAPGTVAGARAPNAKCKGLGGKKKAAKKGAVAGLGRFFGFYGAGPQDNMTDTIAIFDGPLDGAKGSRHCEQVGPSNTTGTCVCKRWGAGSAAPGRALGDMCQSAGLHFAMGQYLGNTSNFAGRKVADKAVGGLDAATAEFMADAAPKASDVPRTCKSFVTEHSEALGRDIKVCSELGDPTPVAEMAGAGVTDKANDGNLAGPLAKFYGLAEVGTGSPGPVVGTLAGPALAVILSKYAGNIPVVNKLGAYGGIAAAGALAFGLTRLPQYKSAGMGALMGLGALTVGVMLSHQMKVALGPATEVALGPATDLVGYLGAIVPDLGAIVPEEFGAIVPEEFYGYGDQVDVLAGGYQNVDVLAGNGPQVDVLAQYDDDAGVDVLAGAFGSLPFAGAM